MPKTLPHGRPFRSSDAPPPAPAVGRTRAPDRGLALLTEDNDAIAGLFVLILEREGWDVGRARDGAGSIRIAEPHGLQLALAIVDCRLADGDGLAVCRALRSRRAGFLIRLASSQLPVFGGGEFLLALGFFPEPFRPVDMQRQISALLAAA